MNLLCRPSGKKVPSAMMHVLLVPQTGSAHVKSLKRKQNDVVIQL